ncbi:Rpn family recombination-promoting nuclease/putative transposase [Salmonella enterica]|nr:Rpn family recombination-promoting nuclease/putative transposase [Salmonella enterica]
MDNEKGHNRPGHDGLFKLFLREPDTARDFLAVHLPADIRAQVRLDTLKLEPGSFVDQKLRELHSDVLYSVETAEGHAGYIYCLVEHQSTADRMMAWRMMRYSMAVMDAHLKKGNDTLPVVVPLLFYQGTVRPYPYSTDWMDCFDAPALAREVYSRPWPLVDVSVMEDSDLQSHRRMALLELVQRDILFSLLETRTFQFTFLNTNITSNASVTSGSTSSMGTSGGTTNSSVSGDSSSSQQTTVDQSRNVYDDMKKTLETMLTPQKGRFWLSASTGTLTVTDTRYPPGQYFTGLAGIT